MHVLFERKGYCQLYLAIITGIDRYNCRKIQKTLVMAAWEKNSAREAIRLPEVPAFLTHKR